MLEIPELKEVDAAFPDGRHTPAWESIPKCFKDGKTKYNEMFAKAFYYGLNTNELKTKPGVDKAKNLKFYRHCAGTFSTKHEHKEAACAWILSETFE